MPSSSPLVVGHHRNIKGGRRERPEGSTADRISPALGRDRQRGGKGGWRESTTRGDRGSKGGGVHARQFKPSWPSFTGSSVDENVPGMKMMFFLTHRLHGWSSAEEARRGKAREATWEVHRALLFLNTEPTSLLLLYSTEYIFGVELRVYFLTSVSIQRKIGVVWQGMYITLV